jgi:probable O-glycosylation ligase (exosortase A-associated)
MVLASIAAMIGTTARTGLVALGVFALIQWVFSRRKILTGVLMLAIAGAATPLLSDEWSGRMNTIEDYGSDTSAMTRLGVWEWTLDYVKDHPLGGGFGVYMLDEMDIPLEDGTIVHQHARAFHSMFFEVLGEQGVIGMAIFLAMAARQYLSGFWIAVRSRSLEPWIPGLSKAILISTTTYYAGGVFTGIAFQPYLYYLFALSIALHSLAYAKVRGDRQVSAELAPEGRLLGPVPAG